MSISSLRIDEIADERPTLDGPATATTATAPADAEEAGFGALVTPRGNLPLHRLSVRAAITGLTVGVKLTQKFHNPFDVPLEATYIFPLPDRAAVTGLTMTAGDRVIEGVLSERGEARATYDAAIAAGQQASIAEEERPDVFTLRVGNILPGEEVTVAFTLVGPLPFADGQAEFRFPWSSLRATFPVARWPASRSAAAMLGTPMRCRTPHGSRRRSCCPGSRTRSTCPSRRGSTRPVWPWPALRRACTR